MSATDGAIQRPIGTTQTADAGFASAFGAARGPDRATLATELSAARNELSRRDELLAELEAKLDREKKQHAVAERSLDFMTSLHERDVRRARAADYRLQAVVYAALHLVPERQLPFWAVHWATDDPGEFQGEFSPRRPYLLHQRVHDGSHGIFLSMRAISPSRLRPHQRPRHWERVNESEVPGIARRMRTRTDEWRFGLAAGSPLDTFSEQDLRALIVSARAEAENEWFEELNSAAHVYPCPANAYLTARQWLEDMPGFRAAVNELRRRRRNSVER